MTTTEDRLADALAARAAGVREDSLRPVLLRPPLARPDSRTRRGLPGRRWLAPLAVAVSIAVIAMIMAGQAPPGPLARPAADGLPGHYVWYSYALAGQPLQLQVRSTATGAVVAQVPDPVGVEGYEWVGAQAGFRAYVAVTFCRGCHVSPLYRFRLTDAGRVTGLSAIRGVTVLSGAPQVETFSLAPDGSHLAYVATAARHGQQTAAIAMLDLRTGVKTIWSGGMSKRGLDLQLRSLSWTVDSRKLAFAAMWCSQATLPRPRCTPWTVRSLDPAAAGGLLSSGSILLRQDPVAYPTTLNPVISPDGTAVEQIVHPALVSGGGRSVPSPNLLTSVNLATGRQTVLHRWVTSDLVSLYYTGGAALVWRQATSHGPSAAARVCGWIGGSGRFQPLPTG